ncbi:probable cytochrome P450 303a1 [Euwallacea similis]|uniref:probable cytochrome P450 303a1 n=1 Tax=Euwallacea similis TaxID=1736056 RepID=UPI00344FEFC5
MFWFALPFLLTILILLAYFDTRKPKNFPPGPRWYPLIGCALEVIKTRKKFEVLYEATAQMCLKYGPVLGLKIGREPIVIMYGPAEIKEMSMSEDLLGRPLGPFFSMRTWNKRLGIILTDREFWQEQKKFVLRHLKEFGYGTGNMSELIQGETLHLLKYIDKSIGEKDSTIFNMESMFSVSVLNSLWLMLAGVRYSPEQSEMKKLQKIMSDLFKIIHMIGAPFSYFPILKYVAPELSGYKAYVETHSLIWDFLKKELEQHKKTHERENPRDLMDMYLNVLYSPDHGESFSEEQLLAICLDMFMAGSETTNNSTSFGFLYLILNPDVQKKTQEEIDSVLGGRPPRLDDRPNMPYTEAVVLEALRMFGLRAFSVPHRALKDTYVAGYFIPKDTLVAANYHGSMMGPNCGFTDPDKFDPERYIIDGKVTIPEHFIPFGIGKRRCMGDSLAKANIFMFITAILQKYDVKVVPESPPDMKVVDGITPAPVHYKAKFIRRKL